MDWGGGSLRLAAGTGGLAVGGGTNGSLRWGTVLRTSWWLLLLLLGSLHWLHGLLLDRLWSLLLRLLKLLLSLLGLLRQWGARSLRLLLMRRLRLLLGCQSGRRHPHGRLMLLWVRSIRLVRAWCIPTVLLLRGRELIVGRRRRQLLLLKRCRWWSIGTRALP